MNVSNLWRKKQMQKPTAIPAPIDPPPAPTEENPRRNGIFVNEKDRSLQIILYQNGEQSLGMALGSLEMAKDMVKQQLTAWHMREQKRPSILVPGNGRSH